MKPEILVPPYKIKRPGMYLMPEPAYRADPCPVPSLNQSLAKIIVDQSPRHGWQAHPRLNPNFAEENGEEDYKEARAIGNAGHKKMLGRGKEIAVAPADYDDWRGKRGDFKAAARAEMKEPILAKHLAQADAMVNAARAQLDACGWDDAFVGGIGEVCLAWEEGGVWFRCLVDWFDVTTLLYDYKTTGASVAPHSIGNKLAEDGWDVQGAMIERGLDVLDPKNAGRRKFRFVAQENYLPHALVPVELTEAHLTMGRKQLAVAVELWCMCMAANKWPAYPSKTVWPDYPGFSETKWLKREIDYADSGILGRWPLELQAPLPRE